jgi:hypothetical protein
MLGDTPPMLWRGRGWGQIMARCAVATGVMRTGSLRTARRPKRALTPFYSGSYLNEMANRIR